MSRFINLSTAIDTDEDQLLCLGCVETIYPEHPKVIIGNGRTWQAYHPECYAKSEARELAEE